MRGELRPNIDLAQPRLNARLNDKPYKSTLYMSFSVQTNISRYIKRPQGSQIKFENLNNKIVFFSKVNKNTYQFF